MSLTPTLSTSTDLFLKLEREAYRVFHAGNHTHTADHLYNFCVTAIAVRDWFFVNHSWSNSQKELFYKKWRTQPLLDACADIANVSKHCKLLKGDSPHTAQLSTTEVVDVYLDGSSNVHFMRNPQHPDFVVTLAPGKLIGVHELTQEVLKFWRSFFKEHNIDVPPQDFETLSGLVP